MGMDRVKDGLAKRIGVNAAINLSQCLRKVKVNLLVL